MGVDPDAEVSTLSIAQGQMVEIAKALSMQAPLLIIDEPTSSLGEAYATRLLTDVQDPRAGTTLATTSECIAYQGCSALPFQATT